MHFPLIRTKTSRYTGNERLTLGPVLYEPFNARTNRFLWADLVVVLPPKAAKHLGNTALVLTD